MAKNSVKFRVDARSLRSYKKNVDMAFEGIAECSKEELVDFCELVLLDSTQLIPIDTGASAQSGEFKITGSRKKGYKAKVGYAIGKRNPINKRTGKHVSAYIGLVHEQMRPHYNGQSKFFEQALYLHESELVTKTGKSIRKYLSSRIVQPKEDAANTNDKLEVQRAEILTARMNQGFTADVDGKYLPFPVPHGMIYMHGGRYFLNREFYKQQKDKRKKSVRKYKSTKQTAFSHRSKEIHRYTREKAPTKKSTKRQKKQITSAKTKVPKKQTRQRKSTGKTKAARASSKTPKKTMKKRKVISDMAHETALDEFMQAMMDGDKEDKK